MNLLKWPDLKMSPPLPHVAWHETLPQNRPKPREETKNKLVLSKIDFCFRLEIYLSK